MNRTIRWGALAALLVPAVWITTSRAQATWTVNGEPAQARPAARPADLVLRGGKIVTVDEARPEAQAMAVAATRSSPSVPIRTFSRTSARTPA